MFHISVQSRCGVYHLQSPLWGIWWWLWLDEILYDLFIDYYKMLTGYWGINKDLFVSTISLYTEALTVVKVHLCRSIFCFLVVAAAAVVLFEMVSCFLPHPRPFPFIFFFFSVFFFCFSFLTTHISGFIIDMPVQFDMNGKSGESLFPCAVDVLLLHLVIIVMMLVPIYRCWTAMDLLHLLNQCRMNKNVIYR